MCENVIKYQKLIPKEIEENNEVQAYELHIKCKSCKNGSIMHISYDFEDTAIFRCLCCGKEKWVPLYGDYGLTGFLDFFFEKYGIRDHMKNQPELSDLYNSIFESYCESCTCGGRFIRSIEPICIKCGSRDIEVISDGKFWRDNNDLLRVIKVDWLKYFIHPF